MPALRMKRMLEDTDFANEFSTKSIKSMKISHFHVSGLEQSAVLNSSDKVPPDGKLSIGHSRSKMTACA
jgi:hypothetical protein